jgi:hypothetical protein
MGNRIVNTSADQATPYADRDSSSGNGTNLAPRSSVLRITELRASGRVVLKLEGRFSAAWVDELDACWRALADGGENDPIWVDLSDVSLVDLPAQAQLARMHRAGVRFLSRGCLMRELVREISEAR